MIRFIPPRWRKVMRDLVGSKARTALVVLSIAVGIFALGVVSGSRGILLRELTRSYKTTNPASGTVLTLNGFNEDLVETIERLEAVAAAEGEREVIVRFRLEGQVDWRELELHAFDPERAGHINQLRPETGVWPPPDKELLVERTSLEWMAARLGDTVIIQLPGGKERRLKITGTVHDQSKPSSQLTGQARGFISWDTLAWLDETQAYNRLLFIVAGDRLDKRHIEAVGNLIRTRLEQERVIVRAVQIPDPGKHPSDDILAPLLFLLAGLGGLALLMSGFLVINTISALLARQTRQIGVMKALGARQRQLMALYLGMVLAYGILSLGVAVPLGMLGAQAFTRYMAAIFNFDVTHFYLAPRALVLQGVVGLLVPLGAAVYPILSGTRLTVREAIADYGLASHYSGAGPVDRLLRQVRGLSRPLLLSLRNTFRRKARLAFTLLTLGMAGITFISVFSLRASLLATLADTLAYWRYDITVRFETDYRVPRIQRVAAGVPGVEAVESWGLATVTRLRPDGREGDLIQLVAPEADTRMLRPNLLAGRWLRPGDTKALVINSDVRLDEPDLKPGDELVLMLAGRETRWQVVGVVQGTLTGPTVYANYPAYARVARQVGRAGGAQIVTTIRDPAGQARVARTLEAAFERAGLHVFQARPVANLVETVEARFDFFTGLLLGMSALLAVVGGLGLSGTMSMNVLERVREIGVMRAIGASDRAITRLVMVEGVVIGLLSWGGGAILAWPVSRWLSRQFGLLFIQKPLTFEFSLEGVALWLLIVVGVAALASLFPARAAARLTVREVLAYE